MEMRKAHRLRGRQFDLHADVGLPDRSGLNLHELREREPELSAIAPKWLRNTAKCHEQ
jgi:hypothetical protein